MTTVFKLINVNQVKIVIIHCQFLGKNVKECGFFMRGNVGASPDGVGDDCLLEK